MKRALLFIAVLTAPIWIGVMAGVPLAGQANSAAGAQTTLDAEWQQATSQAIALFRQGKYHDALAPAQRAVDLANQFGPKDSRRITSLNNLGNLTYDAGSTSEGIALLKTAIDTAKKAFGPTNLQATEPMQSLAMSYKDQGRLAEAESLLEEVLNIRQSKLPPDHPDLGQTYNRLGVVYSDESKYLEAEKMLERAISVQEKLTGYGRSALAATNTNLASVYLHEGKLDQAEAIYKKALSIDEAALGPDHPEVAMILENLGEFYDEQGRFGDADPFYRRSIAIKMKILPANHPEVAASLRHLADLYRDEGKYAEAEPIYYQVLAVQKAAFGADSLVVANTLLNLAVLYRAEYERSEESNKLSKAEQSLQQALDIQTKRLRPDHPDIAITMERLADIYLYSGNSREALPFLQKALAIQKTRVPPNQIEIAQLFWDLGDAALQQGQFEQAETYFKQQLAAENSRGPSARSEECTWDLGGAYGEWGRPAEAEKCFHSDLDDLRHTLETQFMYMSDAERLGFMDRFRLTLPIYFNFVAKYPTSESVGNMYNVLLWEKGLVAAGISAMRARIAASGDAGALALLDEITHKRTQIARMKNVAIDSGSPNQERERLQQLEAQTNDAERELAQKVQALAFRTASPTPTWQSIQSRLRKDEAAVEYVRYRYLDQRQWVGSQYAALVLTALSRNSPTFVPLGDAAALECGPVDDYRRIVGMAPVCKPCSGSPQKTQTFYQAFWKPLEPALAGAHKIYVSGDGVLGEISFAAIQDDAGALLLKKYDLRPLVSTRDLLVKSQISHPRTAVLIGDPKFNATADQQRAALLELAHRSPTPHEVKSVQPVANPSPATASLTRSMDLGDLQWKQLPDTKVELDEIEKLMGAKWRVGSFEGEEALVEAIRNVHGPQVLHIATHGFFLPDDSSAQNVCGKDAQTPRARPSSPSVRDPLLRSGLVFTGANRAASASPPGDLSNGILTAYEAATLDLSGTELVVLSACDTGLGTMFAGEGVLGLRRSFQEAGAESILMSLWSVPSRATEELMKLFYAKWLAGKEKHQALAEAQLGLRSRPEFADPKNWAGFVLVGP